MLFSGKENVFMCLVAFQKMFQKYFLMFGCVLENTIENTFSTCCLHFLTFSWLPNKYIISFIPQNTNKTQKKNHQIRTNEGEIAIGEITIAIAIDTFARSRSKLHAMRRSWSRSTPIGTVPVIARCRRDRNLFFLSPSLSLFYFPRPEVIWSENRNENDFPAFWLWNLVNWKCFSVWPNLK